ncbi:hypothetical protein PAMA_006478 [Pampus argenteus]
MITVIMPPGKRSSSNVFPVRRLTPNTGLSNLNLNLTFTKYEESQLHDFIYQLHVKLLGADKSTVISEQTVNPTEDLSIYSHTWKEVSLVFSGYGPGVRYVHFQHKLKNSSMRELIPTLFTGSSVTAQTNQP